MPCFKTFAMTQATSGELPLQDAVYVASTNKIYAISGIYVVAFNATTGALEASVRISSPVNNGARICYHAANDTLYATLWNEPNLGDTGLTHPNKDVYPINPATMTVGPRLDIVSTGLMPSDFDSALNPAWGPRWIGSSGNYLYIQWNASSYYEVIRVNPTNLADRCTSAGDDCLIYQTEQLCLGNPYIASPDPRNAEVSFAVLNWNTSGNWSACGQTGYHIVGVEFCTFDNLYYLVDGNGNLLRIDDVEVYEDFTAFDLTSLLATADPCRLRYNSVTQLIYLPCQTGNAIIVWNPATSTGVVKTGFENPVDLVFTPTKVWAVQNSPAESLKEVT